ncbi:MAG: hypothetical protein A2Y38_23175 [Spirochaetes bacterium GWB1_59_5]|nr:MAG: hypothetical protein A2Y38_23175 [Spirochaetes bacterium GWB1_59_5]
MIRSALSSAALSGSDIQTVLAAAVSSGVQGIEWTGDDYLAPGDSTRAKEAMYATLRAGLCTASYVMPGRASLGDRAAFNLALLTARELNAPVLRLRPALRGGLPSADAETFAVTARTLGDEAGEHGITLCFSMDADSVLDSCQRAAELLAQIGHPFVKLAWEPAGANFDDAMEAIASLAGRVGLIIVRPDDLDGAGEADGDRSEEWLQYLDALEEQNGSPDMTRHVVFRTMPDRVERLSSAVAAIKSWSATLRRYHQRRVY